MDFFPKSNWFWGALFIASLTSMVAQVLIAYSWRSIFISLSNINVESHQLIDMYGRSNIAKYLPSNVLHFASRQFFSYKYRWPQTKIALASIFETLILLSVGVIIFLFTIYFYPSFIMIEEKSLIDYFFEKINFSMIIPLLIILAIIITCTIWIVRRKNINVKDFKFPTLKALVKSGLFISLFFLLSSLSCFLLALYLTEQQNLLFSTIFFIFSTAWLFGYIVPGAPGGVGVREALLVMLLAPNFGEPGALVLAIWVRIATVVGDLFFLFASYLSLMSRKAT